MQNNLNKLFTDGAAVASLKQTEYRIVMTTRQSYIYLCANVRHKSEANTAAARPATPGRGCKVWFGLSIRLDIVTTMQNCSILQIKASTYKIHIIY